jgi:ribonuclease HI
MINHDYLVVSDGGSRGNGKGGANEGYGSYKIEARDGRQQIVRLDLGTATNNEAEYRILIAALKDLLGRIRRTGKRPADYSLLVQTDAQLLVGQLTQGWRVKAGNLRPLVDEADGLIQAFGRCDLVKVPRDEIVRVLGH